MKNRIYFLIGLIFVCFLMQLTTLGDSLIGFWPLDEGNGNIAHDHSPLGSNGKICGAEFASGDGTWALEFTRKGNFVSIPTREELQVKDNFTFSAWIYPNAVSEGDLIDTLSRYAGYSFALNKGKLVLNARTEEVIASTAVRPGCGQFDFLTETSVVKEKQWQNVVCVYSAEKDEVSFYVDGKKVKTNPKVGSSYCHSGVLPPAKTNTRGKVTYAPYLPMTHILIGAWSAGPSVYGQYYGLIRDVKIFNVALSESDVQKEYNDNLSVFSKLKIMQTKDRKLLGLSCNLQGNSIDADTGKELECTVLVNVDNKYYCSTENIYWNRESPTGTEKETGFISSGKFNLNLPPGKVHVEVTRGLEYYMWQADFELKEGEKKSLDIKLKRLVDMPALGWWCGMHHEHSYGHGNCENYDKFVSPNGWKYYTDAKKADGFNYISHPSPHDGGDFKSTWTDRFICWPTTEDQICSIYTGVPKGGRDIAGSVENMVKTGGHGLVQSYGEDLLMPGQVAISMALDKIDAWIVNEADWFKYLNSGFKCCVGLGSDYYFTYGFVRNMGREYSRMPTLTWENMVNAYKNHATFTSSGALVVFKINDKEIGENVILSGTGEEELNFSISAWSPNGLKKVELIKNGEVAQTFSYDKKPEKIQENFKLKVNDTCWFLVKIRGGAGATTSPIYVQFGKNPMKPNKKDIEYFIASIDEYRKYIDKNPSTQNSKKVQIDADEAQKIYENLSAHPRTWLDDKPIYEKDSK